MDYCNEKILDDIVRADFYDGETCTRSVPFGVPGVESMTVTQTAGGTTYDLAAATGQPVLSMSIAGGSDVQAMMESPKHTAQPKRERARDIYQHTLEIPVETGFDVVKQAGYALSGKEILTVLTAYDGKKICVHYARGSTAFTYSDQRGSSHTGTVKFEAKSLSSLVTLTAKPTT